MNPEDRELLNKLSQQSEENAEMLRSIKRTLFWNQVWNYIKVAIIVIPLIVGYFFLEPYLGSYKNTFDQAKQILNAYQ